MAEARLPAAPLAATINDPRQMSVARSGENLARKAPPGPATTCRAATRLVASLTVIVTRSREAKPLPTTVRGARDGILKVGARRVCEAVATVATAAASTDRSGDSHPHWRHDIRATLPSQSRGRWAGAAGARRHAIAFNCAIAFNYAISFN
jgi:hypothetical protein